MADLAIGIDLGTTNTGVACFKNGSVEILENSEGGRLTPSCVFFLKKSEAVPIVGKCAKSMTDMLPSNGIYEIKRFVGKHFNDVEKTLQYYSFNVENDSGSPVIKIERDNETQKITPQDISALILKRIKKDVEDKLGQCVDKAVITVPAYFNTTQREVTFAAAKQAGFTVLKLFNEPTAAALSYYFKNDDESDCYSLVYDLGGGTFDVSILKRTSSNIDIISVDGDTQLGGKDFDNLLIDHVCEHLRKEYNYDPKKNRRDMRRLQNACEVAKIELSVADETNIILHGFVPNHAVVMLELKKDDFEIKADALIEQTIHIVDRCIKSSKLDKHQIRDVILSGGSSRIPKIQKLLSSYFDAQKLRKCAHFDECVAEGAALQAAMLANNSKQEIATLVMKDVVPLSLGTRIWSDKMEFIIRKGSSIPTSNSITLFTARDQQKVAGVRVYEGERTNVKMNRHLGLVTLENITPAPPGEREILVTFTVDDNGVLTIKAAEKNSQNTKELSIKYARGWRSDSEIREAIHDAEENTEEDEAFDTFSEEKKYFLRYCEAVKYNLRNLHLMVKYEKVYNLCEVNQKKAESLDVDDETNLENLIDETKEACKGLVKSLQFKGMPKGQFTGYLLHTKLPQLY